VLDAVEANTPLRVAGRSHWMDAGRPVSATRIASLATHEGIVDYVPGDLTITVRGGTTLEEIRAVTHAENQWLPLEPFGTPDGTIGATIATGAFGPLAHGFGRARDLVLGVEFVTGDGKVVRGGGRVVKNVAGFDLVRLITGSWGTLGIVTEATLRLYARASDPVTIAMRLPDNSSAVGHRISSIATASLAPYAMEIVSPRMAAAMGVDAAGSILVRLGGNSAAVAAQRATLASLGGMSEVADSVWERMRTAENGVSEPAVLRISSVPAHVPDLWNALDRATREIDGALTHATPRLGIVRCILPAKSASEVITRAQASVPGCTILYERLPSAMWLAHSPSVITDRLSRDVRRAFDPHGILNPGILGPVT
jgi:glycolate oxidase FAD binding subunit